MVNSVESGTVAIVVAVRNGLPHVVETVTSALEQGDALSRLIVVDDGSTDGTGEALKRTFSDPRLTLLTNTGRGVSSARNLGAATAEAPWLLFLDADDRLAPNALATLLGPIQPGTVLVYGDYERMDERGRTFGRRRAMRSRRRKPSGHVLEHLLASNLMINGGVVLCSSDAFVRAGSFDVSLAIAEDWHLWCRVAALGPVVYTPKHVLDYRVHAASVMMRGRRRFEDFAPALQAIFSDSLITRSFAARRLEYLRRRAEIACLTYCAQQALRAHDYFVGATLAFGAIRRHPRRMPWIIGRLAGAIARA